MIKIIDYTREMKLFRKIGFSSQTAKKVVFSGSEGARRIDIKRGIY